MLISYRNLFNGSGDIRLSTSVVRSLFAGREFWRDAVASIKYKSQNFNARPRVRAAPEAGARGKLLDGLVLLPKLMGGFFNAILGLLIAVVFFSYGDQEIVPIVALQSKCNGFSESHSVASERPSLYSACIGQGIRFSRSPGSTLLQ